MSDDKELRRIQYIKYSLAQSAGPLAQALRERGVEPEPFEPTPTEENRAQMEIHSW